ncbi:MAG TPA: VOC family protein [Thalassobaculum sp.]
MADTPDGPVTIRFSEPNWFGVLDHRVRLASGEEIEVPMRVTANGDGAEVTLTLFRRPATSDDDFGRDAEWVGRDLDALKALVEGLPASAGARPSGRDRCIDYVELGVADIGRSKAFYGGAFGWRFTDYGPEYCEFSDGRLKGGLTTLAAPRPGGPLVVLYGDDLEALLQRVEAAGGRIVKPIFGFPGGRRFHFLDPDGHELAAWTAA